MNQITESEWKVSWVEPGYLFQICQLPFSVQEIEEKFNLSFFDYIEDGLGVCFGAFIKIENQKYFLIGYGNKANKNPSVVVHLKSFEKNDVSLREKICQGFRIARSNLL
jgi:hypothetical protein